MSVNDTEPFEDEPMDTKLDESESDLEEEPLPAQKFDLVQGNDINSNFVFQELDLNGEDEEILIRIISGGYEEGDGGETVRRCHHHHSLSLINTPPSKLLWPLVSWLFSSP
ncbi:hypothetical protein Tco_1033666 [Tanacetum coccineum]